VRVPERWVGPEGTDSEGSKQSQRKEEPEEGRGVRKKKPGEGHALNVSCDQTRDKRPLPDRCG
jgi:hypothetical protein